MIIKFFIVLFAGGLLILAIGYLIYRKGAHKYDFDESVKYMREMIVKSKLNIKGYHDCLEAFRDFNYLSHMDKNTYKKLYCSFLIKYKDFLPESEEPKIKIIPDGDGVYNYKIIK
jgi:hypothetical protein